jgi:hypothetical protein
MIISERIMQTFNLVAKIRSLMSTGLSQFEGVKYLSIESYKRSGQPVRTPVWFAVRDSVFYVRTSKDTGKYKRIRNNPNVQIVPCDSRGNVKGEWAKAEAKIATEEEAQQVYKLLQQKYGIMYKMTTTFLRGRNYAVLEIRLKDS